MTEESIDARAHLLGVASHFHQIEGTRVDVSADTLERLVHALEKGDDGQRRHAPRTERLWDIQPPRCFLPPGLRERKAWGISAQLYELRSARNWGIGDFADLAELCRAAAAAGADFVGINPLHALFVADPGRCSPFSPSSRVFLNPIYIAVDMLPGFHPDASQGAKNERLRVTGEVDYAAVVSLKLSALREIWRHWKQTPQTGAYSCDAYDAFLGRGGPQLQRHALFETLSLHFAAAGRGAGWLTWPEEYRDCASPAVELFADRHGEDVQFHTWLQFVADVQLALAQTSAKAAGMRIGLYADLAVGEAPDGSATWAEPSMRLDDMTIGAPPDVFTRDGQNWMLAPTSPVAMAADGFDLYRRTLEASMRTAGALRIDHAMALWHLFMVPTGGTAAQGTYLRYPTKEMLDVLAGASNDNRALVIGEDLGNVPPGFRELMERANILSYRILYFEQRNDGFIPPHDYPELALACLATHDLPTLEGWWRGDDVRLRVAHRLIGEEEGNRQLGHRNHERHVLLNALSQAGLSHGLPVEPDMGRIALTTQFVAEVHRFLARTRSLLACVRLADLTGETVQTNLPGTVDEYPNWRLKNSTPLEDLARSERFRAVTAALAAERPRH